MNKSRYIVIIACSNKHIRASLLMPDRSKVLFCTDTSGSSYGGKSGMEKARFIAQDFAKACKNLGIVLVSLDRKNRSYSGRVKYFADSCREFGLSF